MNVCVCACAEIKKTAAYLRSISVVSKVLGRVVSQRLTGYSTYNNLHEYLQL